MLRAYRWTAEELDYIGKYISLSDDDKSRIMSLVGLLHQRDLERATKNRQLRQIFGSNVIAFPRRE